ncbi:MAG: serine O-acetyltransferase EpsC [Bacteroidales bacterium]
MKTDFGDFARKLHSVNHHYCQEVPSLAATHRFINQLVHLLFPIQENRDLGVDELEAKLAELQEQLARLVGVFGDQLAAPPQQIAGVFFSRLPDLYIQLLEEAEVYLKNDPAAWSVEEIILCYPGFYAICVYRLAHELWMAKVPIIPRIMTEYAHGKTGIDIHPGAQIGEKFFIDHGTGVVIGETTVIGNNVKIYQGVTLGALAVSKDQANRKRHPTIGDNVIIYAGSTILGGNTVIGHDSIVGGNVWLTSGIEPYTLAYRKPKIMYRNQRETNGQSDYII